MLNVKAQNKITPQSEQKMYKNNIKHNIFIMKTVT